MNTVKRTRGIRKMIRKYICGCQIPRYVVAGDTACRRMMRKARSRRQSGPSDQAIFYRAMYDLSWEIVSGFWNFQAA